MFFESDIINFNILDVVYLKQKKAEMHNASRNFCALSFRIHADTVLKTSLGEYHVKDNSISFVPARLNYNRSTVTDELIVVHFDVINCRTKDIEVLIPENPEPLKKLFKDILVCWNEKEIGYKYKCSALLYEILSLCHLQNYSPKKDGSKIGNAVDYMLKHYRDPKLSISEIADKSFISEVYFRKLFKKEYGVSPQKHIVGLRIQYAAELISAGYYSLKEVALMSGYTDYKYFSTEFKKQTGFSPSKYFYNYTN